MTRRNGRGPDSSLKRLWIFIYLGAFVHVAEPMDSHPLIDVDYPMPN